MAQPTALPFQHAIDLFRNEEGDEVAFALRLEQPFLADEFEKSNYLRLASADDKAYLISPWKVINLSTHSVERMFTLEMSDVSHGGCGHVECGDLQAVGAGGS
jgi:hypothetical protein